MLLEWHLAFPTTSPLEATSNSHKFKCPIKSVACAINIEVQKWLPESMRKQPDFVPGWAVFLFTSSSQPPKFLCFSFITIFFSISFFRIFFWKGRCSYVLNLRWVEVKKEKCDCSSPTTNTKGCSIFATRFKIKM